MLESSGRPATTRIHRRSGTAGATARARVEQARGDVAALVGAGPAQVIFTSVRPRPPTSRSWARRASTGSAAAPRHVAHRAPGGARRVPAARTRGFRVTYLSPVATVIVEPAQVEAALRSDTLARLAHAREQRDRRRAGRGAVGRLCRARGVLFHVGCGAGRRQAGPLDGEPRLHRPARAHRPQGARAQGVGRAVRRREPASAWCRLLPRWRAGTAALGHARHAPTGRWGWARRCASRPPRCRPMQRGVGALARAPVAGARGGAGHAQTAHPTRRCRAISERRVRRRRGESLLYALPALPISSGSPVPRRAAEPSYVLRALAAATGSRRSTLRLTWAG